MSFSPVPLNSSGFCLHGNGPCSRLLLPCASQRHSLGSALFATSQHAIPAFIGASHVVTEVCKTSSLPSTLDASSSSPPVGPQLGWPSRLEDDFCVGQLIGAGSYGVVHVATHKPSQNTFAVKVLRKGGLRGRLPDSSLERVAREADILEKLRNVQQVARLVAKYETQRFVYLVLERCNGENLDEVLKERVHLCEDEAVRVIYECLRMLEACHRLNILHGDVKPANFMLMSTTGRCQVSRCTNTCCKGPAIKAVDFGCSRQLEIGQYLCDMVGSPAYMAPEVFLGHFDTQSDLWSLGVTAYQLLAGRLPFWRSFQEMDMINMDSLKRAVLMHEVPTGYGPWLGVTPECVDFVNCLLEKDPAQRMTAAQALQHPWFQLHNCGLGTDMDIPRRPLRNNIVPFVGEGLCTNAAPPSLAHLQ